MSSPSTLIDPSSSDPSETDKIKHIGSGIIGTAADPSSGSASSSPSTGSIESGIEGDS
jgi:hypothetical protein